MRNSKKADMQKLIFSVMISTMLIFFFSATNMVAAETSMSDEFDLIVTPEKPNPGDAVKLQIVDKEGDEIGREEITVYDPEWDKLVDRYYTFSKYSL